MKVCQSLWKSIVCSMIYESKEQRSINFWSTVYTHVIHFSFECKLCNPFPLGNWYSLRSLTPSSLLIEKILFYPCNPFFENTPYYETQFLKNLKIFILKSIFCPKNTFLKISAPFWPLLIFSRSEVVLKPVWKAFED